MSKASAWAARDKERTDKLEAAQRQIEQELTLEGKDKPGPFLNESNVLGEVSRWDGEPVLNIRATYHQTLKPKRAVEFARWILDIFGDDTKS